MKKTVLFAAAMSLGIYGAYAQINLTSSDLPSVGLSYTVYEASSDSLLNIGDSISEGVGGASDTYDISKASTFNEDTINLNMLAASSSMWAANHPGADIYLLSETLTGDGGAEFGYLYGFMESSATDVKVEGVTAIIDTGALFSNNPSGVYDTAHAQYDVKETVIATNYTYGYTGTDASHFSILIANSFVHDEQVDQTIDVDGYGLLTNSNGDFDVIRIKKREINAGFDVLGTDTMSGQADTSYYIEYWAKGVGYPVATIYMDEDWKNVWGVEYINAIPLGMNDYKLVDGVDLYPNPNDGSFTVKLDLNLEALALEVYNAIGQRVLSEPIYSGQNQIDLRDQHNGIYYIVLRDDAGNMVYASEIVKTK